MEGTAKNPAENHLFTVTSGDEMLPAKTHICFIILLYLCGRAGQD